MLYKNGVGFFEHLGTVRGNQDVSIDFTSGQLNDVLNSLTALDLGGGRITAVDYNSQESLARRLGALRLPVGGRTTEKDFLGALAGARLEVRGPGASLVGRLLSVETIPTQKGGSSFPVDRVSLVSDQGEVRTVALGPATSVRILDRELNGEVGRYLGLLASAREQDIRRTVISTEGAGERQLYVSYISEVPVWKTSYRIVLPSKAGQKPLLQGWAIVDNTGGEDWTNVRLSLVAGAPQSFIQELSQPYYAHRPVVSLPQSLQLAPQTHEESLFDRVGSPASLPAVTGALNRAIALQAAQKADLKMSAGAIAGFGGGAGAPGAAPVSSLTLGVMNAEDALERARQAEAAETEGRSLGDLFEYDVKEPVTIRKNESALVPILQTPIEAEEVSLWNGSLGLSRPLRAVWLTNSSPFTLAGGSFSVLAGETFGGEGLVDSVKPGERRLLSYAIDLGLQVDTKSSQGPQRVTRVTILHGLITETSEARQSETYTIRNEDTAPRTLVVEYPRRQGWKLAADEKPTETTVDYYRFPVEIQAKRTATLVVSESEPIATTYSLATLTDEQIGIFLRQNGGNPDVDRVLRAILEKKKEADLYAGEASRRQAQIHDLFDDEARIRENLRALGAAPEQKALAGRYTGQLNDQESRIEALRKEKAGLDAKRASAQEELAAMIEHVSLDASM